MNGNLDSALIWGLLAASQMLFAVSFGYLYHKDKDKRKLMFTIAFSTSCFSISALGMIQGLVELAIFAEILAILFLVLVFVTVKEGAKEGIGSFFVLKRELEREKEKFPTLFNLMADPVAIVDKSGKILEITERVKEITGFEKEELIGKNFLRTNIMTAKSKAILIKNLAKRIMGTPIAPYEIEIIAKDGRKGVAEVNAVKIEYEGKPAALVVFRDITERKKLQQALEESEEKYRALFENSPDGVITFDLKGNVTECNKAMLEYGFKKEDIIGKNLTNFIPKKYWSLVEKDLLNLERGQFTRCEVELETNNGIVCVEFNSSPIKGEGKTVGVQSILRDVTQRKQMEEKLEEYSQQLEELVEKRTKQLKETQKQLLKSERLAAIGELAAMVGHDLRNPLTGIAGATYYLKTKLDSGMNQKSMEMLEFIEKDIEYLNNIITDLLEYSREIRLELRETTPKSITKEALSFVKVPENIQASDLTQDEPKIKVDAEKMKRVFVNIIQNAIDAMPEGGELTITSNVSSGILEVAFTDTGIGMSKEVMEKLWTPLFSTKAKGMGLGLAICKRIVEAHGGNISVESAVGEGTAFTVTIPIKPRIEGGEKIWMNQPESSLLTTMKA
jgi:PAS domain S-box-containing protein